MMRNAIYLALIVPLAAGTLSGCGGTRAAAEAAGAHASGEHGHESPHGGRIRAVGDHQVEVVREQGRGLTLYILGKDEAELVPIPLKSLDVELSAEDGEASTFTLKARPQAGDPGGSASRFSGELPLNLAGEPISLAAALPLAGKSYRVRFELDPHRRDRIHPEMAAMLERQSAMPEAATGEQEQKLYFTPGGLYTAEDIAANGQQTPAEKFRGVVSAHDANPKKGERVCPITGTKANPKFSWTVGGKQYLFCCPPCVDEFVRRAKEKPSSVKAPEAYSKH
ncbi:MAG: hypothetical protein FJX77_07740 [Armatimonadetes bacterium]|nr:hypothetical protein [Armatimonadota bacterium]